MGARENDGWEVIPTSVVGNYNDVIALYIKETGKDGVLISDDGEAVGECFPSFSEEKKQRIKDISSRYGIVCQESGELTKETTSAEKENAFRDFVSALEEIRSSLC